MRNLILSTLSILALLMYPISLSAQLAIIPSPDFDTDGEIGFADFLIFTEQFGFSEGDEGYEARFDLNGNGEIGFADFLIFVDNFGKDKSLFFTDPGIYNDNVFVLPVQEDIADLWTPDKRPPLRDYAVRFYEFFKDEFDFLMVVPALPDRKLDSESFSGAYYNRVSNDVEGIGLSIFSRASLYGSAGQLQGMIFFAFGWWERSENSRFTAELPLHELMHRWANHIVRTTDPSHWGFSSANGSIGGFDIAKLVDLGDGRYSIRDAKGKQPYPTGGLRPYSPVELYLAGFIPPEEVPDLWVAEDAEWVYENGWIHVKADDGGFVFTASRVKTYTIEDIIALHGPRVPDHTQSQKDFRAAVILLTNEKYPVHSSVLARLSASISWFSYPGYPPPPIGPYQEINRHNFYKETVGLGTITMDGLSQLQRSAGAKRPVPSSVGTSPPPIIE